MRQTVLCLLEDNSGVRSIRPGANRLHTSSTRNTAKLTKHRNTWHNHPLNRSRGSFCAEEVEALQCCKTGIFGGGRWTCQLSSHLSVHCTVSLFISILSDYELATEVLSCLHSFTNCCWFNFHWYYPHTSRDSVSPSDPQTFYRFWKPYNMTNRFQLVLNLTKLGETGLKLARLG